MKDEIGQPHSLCKRQPASLFSALTCLTLLFIFGQLTFFYAHFQVSDLIDAFAKSSIARDLWHPAILLPLLGFIAIQIVAYLIFTTVIWFIATAVAELFGLSRLLSYILGIGCWVLAVLIILSLNNYYYPASFYAWSFHWLQFVLPFSILFTLTLLAYWHVWHSGKHKKLGVLFFLMVCLSFTLTFYDSLPISTHSKQNNQPNIILIGLDSVRPDFTGELAKGNIQLPHINHFLQTSTTFTQAYTPLARTFPSWVSLLTAKYPKHHQARINLIDPQVIVTNDMLSKKLKAQGYVTIYATDEPRFTDINADYGFDRLIGPKGGAVEFLLGGLSDFPLTNLLINLPLGRYLFPYNYGNRAADITYQPDRFLQLVKSGLANRPDKPVFLALHLCLSHWPFTWAQDGLPLNAGLSQRYPHSLQALDGQLGGLLKLLKQAGLLEHSLVVLLSDHGVTLGLPNDRAVVAEHYRGLEVERKRVAVYPLSGKEGQFSISTSYGQGTDVLSLKQNQVILSFKGFGVAIPAKKVAHFVSLLDVAPTILEWLHISPLHKADGLSLAAYFSGSHVRNRIERPFYIETADTIADTGIDKAFAEKIVKQWMGTYQINTLNGQLTLNPAALPSIIKNKQRAILFRDWMLAYYPAQTRMKLMPIVAAKNKQYRLMPYVQPSYFVLLNRKTGLWTTELTHPWVKTTPFKEMMQQFLAFYGDELT